MSDDRRRQRKVNKYPDSLGGQDFVPRGISFQDALPAIETMIPISILILTTMFFNYGATYEFIFRGALYLIATSLALFFAYLIAKWIVKKENSDRKNS